MSSFYDDGLYVSLLPNGRSTERPYNRYSSPLISNL